RHLQRSGVHPLGCPAQRHAKAWTPNRFGIGSIRMTAEEIAPLLEALGCPAAKCLEMAKQLDRGARQLPGQKDKTYDEALAHLLSLMKQGWAAKERGL